MLAVGATTPIASNFINLCKQLFGDEGDLIASELVSGFRSRALDSATGLWDLAVAAREAPAVASYSRTRQDSEFLAGLEDVMGGPAFRRRLDEYLDEFWPPKQILQRAIAAHMARGPPLSPPDGAASHEHEGRHEPAGAPRPRRRAPRAAAGRGASQVASSAQQADPVHGLAENGRNAPSLSRTTTLYRPAGRRYSLGVPGAG